MNVCVIGLLKRVNGFNLGEKVSVEDGREAGFRIGWVGFDMVYGRVLGGVGGVKEVILGFREYD